jgi:hypothetical protein
MSSIPKGVFLTFHFLTLLVVPNAEDSAFIKTLNTWNQQRLIACRQNLNH